LRYPANKQTYAGEKSTSFRKVVEVGLTTVFCRYFSDTLAYVGQYPRRL